MAEFAPVTEVRELCGLDDDQVLGGYMAGFRGDPEPVASVFSRSWWHGWRNGAVDGGHRDKDAAQAILAQAFVAAQSATLAYQGVEFDPSHFPLQ